MLKVVNLKEFSPTVDIALASVQIAMETAKREGVTAIKVLHGYGSHGRGGAILIELRKLLRQYKKQGQILDFFGGESWDMFNEKTLFVLNRDKSIVDEDLGRANPGITIIVLK